MSALVNYIVFVQTCREGVKNDGPFIGLNSVKQTGGNGHQYNDADYSDNNEG